MVKSNVLIKNVVVITKKKMETGIDILLPFYTYGMDLFPDFFTTTADKISADDHPLNSIYLLQRIKELLRIILINKSFG